LRIVWWLAAGTDYTSGTLQTTWAANTNANRAVGQTNLAAATNNYWQVTGVQLEAGSIATPFEFEEYGETLAKCQRYYYRNGAKDGNTTGAYSGHTMGYMFDADTTDAIFHFPVAMRAVPTFSFSGISSNLGASSQALTTSGDVGSTTQLFFARFDHAGSRTAGQAVVIHNNNNTSGFVAFSAEL